MYSDICLTFFLVVVLYCCDIPEGNPMAVVLRDAMIS